MQINMQNTSCLSSQAHSATLFSNESPQRAAPTVLFLMENMKGQDGLRLPIKPMTLAQLNEKYPIEGGYPQEIAHIIVDATNWTPDHLRAFSKLTTPENRGDIVLAGLKIEGNEAADPVDLAGAILFGADVSGRQRLNLANATVKGNFTNLELLPGSSLSNCVFEDEINNVVVQRGVDCTAMAFNETSLRNCRFYSNMTDVEMTQVLATNTTFNSLTTTETADSPGGITASKFVNCDFLGSSQGAKFSRVDFDGCRIDADMTEANMYGCSAQNTIFSGSLAGAHLQYLALGSCRVNSDMAGSTAKGLKAVYTTFNGSLANTAINSSRFAECDLSSSSFHKARVLDSKFEDCRLPRNLGGSGAAPASVNQVAVSNGLAKHNFEAARPNRACIQELNALINTAKGMGQDMALTNAAAGLSLHFGEDLISLTGHNKTPPETEWCLLNTGCTNGITHYQLMLGESAKGLFNTTSKHPLRRSPNLDAISRALSQLTTGDIVREQQAIDVLNALLQGPQAIPMPAP